jgi:hypothetical protein
MPPMHSASSKRRLCQSSEATLIYMRVVFWDWAAKPPGFVVLYTAGTAAPPMGGSIRFIEAARSYAQLEAVRDEVAALAIQHDAQDSGLISVGIDEPTNTVLVALTRDDAPLRKFLAKYDDAVSIAIGERAEPAACYSKTDCTPFRGGIYIQSTQLACSYGLNGRRNGSLVMVTAGHCDWNVTSTWTHPNTQGLNPLIGSSSKNGLRDGLDTDVLRVTASGPQVANPLNRIYDTNSRKSLAIQGVVSNTLIYRGMLVTRSGFKTTTAGTVTGDRYLYCMWLDGWCRFAWGWPSNTYHEYGDSGGPFYSYQVEGSTSYWALVGFLSLKDGTFAGQGDAKRVLSLDRFCTSDSC